MNIRSSSRQRGAALVLTLIFVTLITLVAIGFVGLMQLERASASRHLGGIQADLYAREAENMASMRLYVGLGSTTKPWVSQPGAIYSSDATLIPLNSGYPLADGTSDQNVDLNPASLTSPNENLIGTNVSMIVQWIYQFQDGTFATGPANIPPPFNSANPVIGRFGFWVDDESSKLNINTAAEREITNQISNPAQVALGTNAADPANILAYRNSIGAFNTVSELGRATNVSTGLSGSTFDLTTYNHSPVPRVNMLGKQPILLTTQASVAQACGYTNYLNILNTPNTDPGSIINVNVAAATTVVNNIIAGLTNTGWPIMTGKSFKSSKYADVASIAANIVEYVRCAESTNLIVEPLSGNNAGNSYTELSAGNVAPLAVGRHPVISQMATFFPTNSYNAVAGGGQANYYYASVALQLYFPTVAGGWNNNGAGIPLSSMQARADVGIFTTNNSSGNGGFTVFNGTTNYWTYTFTQASSSFTTEDFVSPTATNIMPGGYATVVSGHRHGDPGDPLYRSMGPLPPNMTVAQNGAAGNHVQLNVALMSANPASPTPSGNQPNGSPPIPMLSDLYNQTASLPMTSQSLITNSWVSGNPQTVAIDDPFANYWNALWNINATDVMGSLPPHSYGTLGSGTYVSGVPQQDTDANGKLVEGVVVPAPKGSPQNPNGLVQSLGELGFVHTGNSGYAAPYVVPWRTIRLQPEKQGSTYLPDWLILELFAVPSTNIVASPSSPLHSAFLQPNNVPNGAVTNVYAMGGTVNLNANLLPFTNYPARLLPLESVLQGISNNAVLPGNYVSSPPGTYTLPAANIPTVATNILGQVLASQTLGNLTEQGRTYTNSALPNQVYYSPGQVAEIAGVADSGEASEEMVRQLTALTTVRGNVFTIFSIGQSLKQDSSGTLHIEGESRRRETIERYYGSDGAVHLQTVSSSRLQL